MGLFDRAKLMLASYEEKKMRSHVKNLITIAQIDNVQDEDEMNYFNNKIIELNVDLDEMKLIYQNREYIESFYPLTYLERRTQIMDVINLAYASGYTTESKLKEVYRIANFLDIPQSVQEDMIFLKSTVGFIF